MRTTHGRVLVVLAVAVGAAAVPTGARAQEPAEGPAVTVAELGGDAARFLPLDVNDRGQVLGRRMAGSTSAGDVTGDVSLFEAGRFVSLAPAPAPGARPNFGYLNERGEAVVAVPWYLGTFPIRCTSSLWAQGRTTSVSALDTACAVDVNDRGQVLINPILANPASWWLRPSVWSAGWRVYSPQPAGGATFFASAIGATGVVVGYLVPAVGTSGGQQAAIWQPGGQITPLGTLGGMYAEANAATPDGAVIGTSGTGDGDTHLFVWRPATGMVDLGAPGDFGTVYFQGVNDEGHIAVDSGIQTFLNDQGDTITASGGSTYLWRDGVFVEVERDPNLHFRAINDHDQLAFDTAVRNAVDVRRSPTSKAFLWDEGRLIDLDATVGGDATSTAEAINDLGQVAGTDGDGSADGPRRGVLWTVTSRT
jgi:probable HAF family extracellular repeat protein